MVTKFFEVLDEDELAAFDNAGRPTSALSTQRRHRRGRSAGAGGDDGDDDDFLDSASVRSGDSVTSLELIDKWRHHRHGEGDARRDNPDSLGEHSTRDTHPFQPKLSPQDF